LPNIWQPVASINYGKAIAFASSDPQTGYVCGDSSPDSTRTTLELGVTHDGGFTWATHNLGGITGASCSIAVNPYDANDIVLSSISCWEACGGADYNPYRSVDGGMTWTHLIIPPGNEASGWIFPGSPVWTPAALFFFVTSGGASGPTPPAHLIAVSVNGGPLAWTTNPGPPASDSVIQIFTSGNSINSYIGVQVNGQFHDDLATSTDNGKTWTHLTPQGVMIGSEEILPNYFQPVSDSLVIVGLVYGSANYLRTTDGGKSWNELPTLPGPGNSTTDVGAQAMPDGTIIGVVGNTKTGVYVFKLGPQATSWTTVATIPSSIDQTLSAVSWDTNGHPRLIWTVVVSGTSSSVIPILEYHPA
jgi:hypothetical protein